MLPQPVIALLLLFPITDESEAASKAGKGSLPILSSFPPMPTYHSDILCMPASASKGPYFRAHHAPPAEDVRLIKEGYIPPKEAFFMKQTIGNACGTIGVLHALANNQNTVSISERCQLLALHAFFMLSTCNIVACLAV